MKKTSPDKILEDFYQVLSIQIKPTMQLELNSYLKGSLSELHSMIFQGYKKLLHDQYQGAKKIFEKVLNIDLIHGSYGLGNTYYEQKDYKAAIQQYTTALKDSKNSFSFAYYGWANCLKQQRKYAEAIELLDNAIKLNAQIASFWNAKGFCLKQLRQYSLATECYEKAKNIASDYPNPINGLGNIFYELREYDKSLEHYNTAIKINEKFAYPYTGLGNVYRKIHHYNQAIKSYKTSIGHDPNYYYAFNGLGNVYRDLKNNKRAIINYEKAIHIDRNLPLAWNGLGLMYFEKDFDEAVRCFKEAIGADPSFPHAYRNLGLLYLSNNRFEESLDYLNSAYELFNDYYNNSYWQRVINIERKHALRGVKTEELWASSKKLDPAARILKATRDEGIEEQVLANKKLFSDFLQVKNDEKKENDVHFIVLRRWNSYTPLIKANNTSKGGGYFLRCRELGIVIDPGLNFIDNLIEANYKFHEIDKVLISHAHNDHTADLEAILTLLYRYNEEIKESDDPLKEDTITKQLYEKKYLKEKNLAEQQNRPMSQVTVTREEVEEEFLSDPRRKIIDFYFPMSVFKKYSGLFQLYERSNYNIHVIEPGNKLLFMSKNKAYPNSKDGRYDIAINILKSCHDDIISDKSAVGFIIKYIPNNTTIVYTGDTGWRDDKPDFLGQYDTLNKKTGYKLLVAHIGGFKVIEHQGICYKNHLGRIGLAKLVEKVKPDICFLSEFGEEFRNDHRVRLAKIMQDAFNNNPLFFPADIGLKFNLKTRRIEAIAQINKNRMVRKFIEPDQIDFFELDKDYSLHYFNKDLDWNLIAKLIRKQMQL
ncbi:tetratricopeptide repeat protein [Syntrophomonas curvata]